MGPERSPELRGRRLAVAAVLIAAVAAGAIGYSTGRLSALTQGVPSTFSVEAGFARDMQTHHDQGVEMAMLIYERTDDDDVRLLAYDIATTQAQQSGQMYGWLSIWNAPQYSSEPPMSWMSEHDEHGGSGGGPMPGMASPEQLDQLRSAEGPAADRLFLELMIDHHQGAVEMADAVLALSDDPDVTSLAGSIVQSQTAELKLLRELLTDVPTAP